MAEEQKTEAAPDQDAMAAAMAAEAAGGAPAPETDESGRVLNQDEIDSLLGFDEKVQATASGIQALVNSSMVSYERLPMLEVVFDRMVRLMTTSLRNFTSDNVEVSLDNITSIRFGDYLNSIPLPALISVIKAEEWDNLMIMTLDASLTYSVVDVLLGGRRGTAAMRIEGRPYTTIERTLMERMIRVVLADLGSAFDPLSSVTFRYDRLETNPRFATIVQPANAAILVKFRIDMEDRGGKLELIIPYATLEPIREVLLQMFMGEKFGHDSIWENHLASELWQTDVNVDAILDEVFLPLSEVLAWKPGTKLYLDATVDSDIEMRCGDIPMFKSKLGQLGDKLAVKIQNKLVKKKQD